MSPTLRIAARAISMAAFSLAVLAGCNQAGQPAATAPAPAAPPAFTTVKVSDSAYAFRMQGYQSMFVVGKSAVLVFDPNGFNKPNTVPTLIAEIRKVTPLPVKYVVYSHDHLDHASGGMPFKQMGAKFIGQRNGVARIAKLNKPELVVPIDIPVDNKFTVDLGGNVKVDLLYLGRNHSDTMLVGLVAREKVIFVVDFIPIEGLPFRDFPDTDIDGTFTSIDRVLALDWTTMVPGHPYAGGRFGTKQDVQNTKQYLTDLRAAVGEAFAKGRCYDNAMKEVKLPKYEKWGNYETALPLNVGRMCEYFNTLQ